MAVQLSEIVACLDAYLEPNKVQDYCPNGLQVEGSSHVSKIIGGVTATQALIDMAIEKKADAILVHHGYFWKGEDPTVRGIKRNRLKSLLTHDISLLAYHLPLDIHPVVGNNIQLANLLGLSLIGPLDPTSKNSIGIVAELDEPTSANEFCRFLSQTLGREALHIGVAERRVKRIGLCTGAAQGMIDQAIEMKLDAYISGEISEPTVHSARESGISYFAAGHHATEKGGVMALGKYLETQFEIDFEFIDLFNPV